MLGPDAVSMYYLQNGKSQLEQTLPINNLKPWPLDLRGRLVQASDHTLRAYVPGVVCRINYVSKPADVSCHTGDDPWPIVVSGMTAPFPSTTPLPSVPALSAFFAPTRNYFTGVLSPAIGKFNTVGKFYSAAFIPREKWEQVRGVYAAGLAA